MLRWQDALDLIWAYFKKKTVAQMKAVAFIVIYLFCFQTFILDIPIHELPKIILGIVFVVIGLTLFMEGLILGIMPIGENLGIRLPAQAPLFAVLIFAFILGIGATFAEPAIGILRAMGSSVEVQRAPLLYYILNEKTLELIVAVGVGVGLAVIFGVLRLIYNWSLKPLIYPLVITTLGLSLYSLFNADFAHIVGLAWDCGAVTTGPVTVPLVIALGIGMSRVVAGHSDEGTTSGFGVVTLASLFPVVTVLMMGIYYNFNQPEDIILESSIQRSSTLNQEQVEVTPNIQSETKRSIQKNFIIAAQAILPLCLFMLVVFRLFLRQSFKYVDEIALGLFLSLMGLTIFSVGVDFGLGKMGKQVGQVLPSAYSVIRLDNETKMIENFNLDHVQTRYSETGEKESFFYLNKNKKMEVVIFNPDNFDAKKKTYTFTPSYGPIWNQDSFSLTGILVVLFFAFLMGYGATLAEPALNTLGATVEDLSVGTFKKSTLIQSVAIGVGIGILIGVIKIIWSLPLIWLLLPPYVILLILTAFSTEEYVNIAWDSAGVTTGPVTVPLVLSMGLGIGAQSGAVEGFGILAMASVCPIMSVLLMGLFMNRFRRRPAVEDFDGAQA